MPERSRITREEMAALFRGRSARLRGRFLDLAHAPLANGPKIACVVSKKSMPRAVDRNKVRRRVRSILSPLLRGSRARAALIVTVRAEAAGASFAQIADDLAQLAAKALSAYNGPI